MTAPSPPPVRQRTRLRRALRIALPAAVLLPLVLVLAVLLGLRSTAARRAVLDRVSAYLAEELGLALAVEDFDLRWGGLELEGVRVGAPGAPPVLVAERVDAAVDFRTLRREVLVFPAVEIVAPRLDLAAPIPKLPESDPQAPPGFEIRRFAVRRGSVVGATPEPPLSGFVRSWRADGIEAAGSFRGGRWDVNVESARARVERPGFEPLLAEVGGRIGYRDGEPVRLAGLRATGDGLRLSGSGTVGLEPGSPAAISFDAEAEPRLLVAGTPPGGSVRAAGNLRFPEGTGRVEVAARSVPAETLRPYVEAPLFRDVSLAGTVADARADVVLGREKQVAGEGEAVWRRGARRLARADLRVEPGPPLRLTADGDLLPGSPGYRRIRGTLAAQGWAELAEAAVEKGEAEVRLPDVRAALAEVRALWPRLIPAVSPDIPARGALEARARFSGPLDSPRARVNADWRPEPGARVQVQAEGLPLKGEGRAEVVAEGVPLGLIPRGPEGTVSGRFEIAGSPRRYQVRAHATVAQAAYSPWIERLETAHLVANGGLVVQPLSYTGTLTLDGLGLAARPNASDTARIDRFQLAADGAFRAEALSWHGTAALDVEGLDAPAFARAGEIEIRTEGRIAGSLASLAGSASLQSPRIELPSAATAVTDLRLEAEGDGREVTIATLSGGLPENGTFAASGRFTTDPRLAEADLDLRLDAPVKGVRAADLTASLRQGTVELSAPRIETDSGPASVRATIPLGALRQIPALADALAGLPLELASGPVVARIEASALDSAPLLAALGAEPRPERVRAGVTADVVLEPGAPAAGSGEIRIDGLRIETPGGTTEAESPVVARLAGGALTLEPVRLRVSGGAIDGAGVDLRGRADLDPAWNPFADPPAAAVRSLAASAGGTLDAALLNPFLEGGVAAGGLTFQADIADTAGPPDGLVATVRASAPGASFYWPTPYSTRLQEPEIQLALRDGAWTIENGRAVLNGGEVTLSGSGTVGGDAVARVALEDVRYRLDYGVSALLDGLLTLRLPAAGRPRLEGTVSLERGVLDRDLNLDREVLSLFLQPDDTPGAAEAEGLAAMELDLAVTTVDGLRVRNNVADLRLWWQPLAVTGTLDRPVIRGRIDFDPDGYLVTYGQTVRIDRGAVIFRGDPLTDPRIDLATTSSLEDPTIAPLRGTATALDILDAQERDPLDTKGPDLRGTVEAGLTGYYGERLVSRLGETVGISGLSVRGMVFQETDPTARLNVGRDLSPNVSFAVSLDLRQAERRTYLLGLRGFRELPGLELQGFSNDEGNEGATLQQALELGGSRPERSADENTRRLRRLRLSSPGLSFLTRRLLRRSIRLERGEPVPESAAFDIEVELADALRRRGYPDPRVTVAVAPSGRRKADVTVAVEPGPRARFAFEGDRPPRALRPEIASLYRTDFYEPASLEEMKEAAVQAFRSRGHPDPRGAVEVRREADDSRTVLIRSEAGPRLGLEELRIAGVDAETARAVAAAFPGTLARTELAAGLPGADRRLLAEMRVQGFPSATVSGRSVERGGSLLVVGVVPGERQLLKEVAIAGVEGEERERLREILPVRPGAPARLDRIAEGALRLERALEARGFPDALVRPVQTSSAGLVDLRYEVTPGPRVRVAEVAFDGERWSRLEHLARLVEEAGLEAGKPLTGAAVEDARAELVRTRAFLRVTSDVSRTEEGEARVTFSLSERPRFKIRYGARWENGVEGGLSGVVDVLDENFLGRGMTLGMRGLYKPEDRQGRLFLRTPELLATGLSLETYALVRRQFPEEGLIQDTRELALQAAQPFGRHVTGRLYARYRESHLFEEEPDPFFPFDIQLSRPYVGLQALWDSRDDRIDPTGGLFASADLSGAGEWLGSDFEYLRLFTQANLYRSLSIAGRPLVWAQSARVGLARAFSGQELLREERFFAGGELSVRGYETESLGPEERLGALVRPLGGEALLILNQELRFRLPLDLTGLVFLDAGQVWDEARDADLDLATALGLGLRARTPIGLLRFDAGFPLDRRKGDPGYRLYFGFGNAF